MLDVRLPWCGTFTTRRRAGGVVAATSRSTGLADVARQQHRHVAPAQLEHERVVVADLLPLPVGRRRMARGDLDAVDRRARSPRRRSPSARRRACAASRSARQRLEARHRNAFPHLARPELAQDRRGAADVIGIAVRQREVVEPAEPGVAERPARRRGRRCRTRTMPDRPPASTSSVEPRGKTTNAESPWPTSRNVTCRRPSPRAATSVRGSARIQSAAAAATSAETRAAILRPPVERRAPAQPRDRERGVVDGDRDPRRRRDPVGERRREPHEIRRPHEAGGAERARSIPRSAASAPRDERQRHDRHAGDLRDAPSAESRESSAPARRT